MKLYKFYGLKLYMLQGEKECQIILPMFSIRFFKIYNSMWALTRENLSSGLVYEKQRRRPACASAQTDQRLCYSRIGKYPIYTSYK